MDVGINANNLRNACLQSNCTCAAQFENPHPGKVISVCDEFQFVTRQVGAMATRGRPCKPDASIRMASAATRWAEKLNLLELCAMFGFKPDIAARVYVNLDAKKIAEKLK